MIPLTDLNFIPDRHSPWRTNQPALRSCDIMPQWNDPLPIPKTPLNMAAICDFALDDHNGMCLLTARDALVNEIPFICSKSILKGTKVAEEHRYPESTNYVWDGIEQIGSILCYEGHKWHIWEEKTEEELLVFIPVYPFFGRASDEVLGLFGLDAGRVVSTTPSKALEGHQRRSSFHSFLSIFQTSHEIGVRMILVGHGTKGKIGGMEVGDYTTFLSFHNEHRNCEGVTVSSCYAGGENKSCHDDLPLGFPVVLHSIGDFSITYQPNLLSSYLNPSQKSQCHEAEPLLPNPWTNLGQIKLPINKKFILLNDAQSSSPLEEVKLTKSDPKVPLNRRIIHIFSRRIRQRIEIQKCFPLLLSMKSNFPCHVIDSITFQSTLTSFLQSTTEVYQTTKLAGSSSQVFFIKELITDDDVFSHVTLYCAKGNSRLLAYHLASRLYLDYTLKATGKWDSLLPEIISKNRFSLLTYHWTKKRIDSSIKKKYKALDEVVEGLKECQEGLSPLLNLYLKCVGARGIPKGALSTVKKLMISHDYDPQDILLLLCICVSNRETALLNPLLQLVENTLDNPVEGQSLLHHATQASNDKAVEQLLRAGSNPNHKDALYQKTPLHFCVMNEDTPKNALVLNALLNAKQIDPSIEDASGLTPLAYATTLTRAKMLVKMGAEINLPYLKSPLRSAILSQNSELVQFYLRKGASPNIEGNSSPLFDAINLENHDIIRLLLKFGADPTKRVKGGANAMMHCAIAGTPEVLEILARDAILSIPENEIIVALSDAIAEASCYKNTALVEKAVSLIYYPFERKVPTEEDA